MGVIDRGVLRVSLTAPGRVRARRLLLGLPTVLVLASTLLTLGAPAARAAETPSEHASVAVFHEGTGSELEVCLASDRGDPLDADDVLDQLRALWPLVAELEAEDLYGCWYLELPLDRLELDTGDGFATEVTVPPLVSLATSSRDVEVAVCTVRIEVTTEVAPATAGLGDGCGSGYLGVQLDPSVEATVSVVARAPDAFLLQRTLLLAALVAAVAVAAFALAATFGRRLAVRSAGTASWQVVTLGVLLGLVAAGGVVAGGWVLGALDAWVVRANMASSVVVAIVAGSAAACAVLLATRRVLRLRRDETVLAAARRRGIVDPSLEDVPEDLRDLAPPRPLAVPPAPRWGAVVRAVPGTLLWLAGLGGLWVTAPGVLPTVALGVAVVGAALTWVVPRTTTAQLDAERFGPEREQALLAAARELGLHVRTVRRSSVQLPEDDLGPAPALVQADTLYLSPAVDRSPAHRAVLVAIVGRVTPRGLGPAWYGAVALVAGGFLDGISASPFGALVWWTLLPAALLVVPSLRWLRTWQVLRQAERSLDPAEVVDASVEVAWLGLRQLGVDAVAVRMQPVPSHNRYGGKLDDTMVDRVVVDGTDDELAIAWPLLVASLRAVEAEVGAPPGTAAAAARRLSGGDAPRSGDPSVRFS